MGVRERSIWSMTREKILEPTQNLTYAHRSRPFRWPEIRAFHRNPGLVSGGNKLPLLPVGRAVGHSAHASKPQPFHCRKIPVHTVTNYSPDYHRET